MLNPRFRFAAVILAAGRSRRFGVDNKLLAEFRGKPLVFHCLDKLSSLGLSDTVVVIGYEAKRFEPHLNLYDIRIVTNEHFSKGMGTSLAVGAAALADNIDAAFVCLADMPVIEPSVLCALSDVFGNRNGSDICVPVFDAQFGHPVLFGRRHFSALRLLEGDEGARNILAANCQAIQRVNVSSSGVISDCDTAHDFRTIPTN